MVPPRTTRQWTLPLGDVDDGELDLTVVDEHRRPLHRAPGTMAGCVTRRKPGSERPVFAAYDDQRRPARSSNGRFDLGRPDFRALRIDEHADAVRDRPQVGDDGCGLVLTGMAHVDADDVHAGFDELAHHVGRARGRPDGGDDLRFAHGFPPEAR
jgi:hypothetical protein